MSRSIAPLAATLLAWPLTLAQADTPPKGTERLGAVEFAVSCTAPAEFNRAVALLHSFWFPPADQGFRAIAAKDPSCGMAWWGVAMVALGNPLAGAPTPQRLKIGSEAVQKAQAASAKTERERDYIAAISEFYRDADKVTHRERARAYEQAMERLVSKYADDSEAKIFYALSLNITFDPADKSYKNQLKAAGILGQVLAAQPQHPGIAHYMIHSYDFPPIAAKGLDAAKRYAKIAPDSPHALHMPSHIFTRVGHWQDSIDSNRAAAEIARKEYAATGANNAIADAYHAYDYMAYAHLQLAQDKAAKAIAEKILEMRKVDLTGMGAPIAAPFALAAIPVRYALEREQWADAAKLELPAIELPWDQWPQAVAIVAYGRGIGAARTKDIAGAERALSELKKLHEALVTKKQAYWANQVEIQAAVVEAWIKFSSGKADEGLAGMRVAAEWEGKTEKHPVTPGPMVPAHELLGDMLMQAGKPKEALAAYEHSMQAEPNRFRGLAGAARAAELAGEKEKAKQYYQRLLELAAKGDGDRPALKMARDFVGAK